MPIKKQKFNNKIIQRAEGKFDSKGEYAMWCQLKRMQSQGLISELKRQIPFVLIEKSKWGRQIKYIADFTYLDAKTGEYIVADFKGVETDVFKIKRRLMAELYGIQIKILRRK